VCSYTLRPKHELFPCALGVDVHLCAHLWSSKVFSLPVCLSTSSGLAETAVICQHPWECYVKNKRTTKNMTLQEDACLVASFIQMNVFCVQDLQTRPQKIALNMKNTWMPKKLSSEVASCRKQVEGGNGHGVWSQGLLLLLALSPAKMYF